METIPHTVAAEVRAELARQNRRKQDLANALGVSTAVISRRLNDQSPFSIEELVQVADFLDVPLSQLLPTTEAVQ